MGNQHLHAQTISFTPITDKTEADRLEFGGGGGFPLHIETLEGPTSSLKMTAA
jgi:hypothetical protein